MPRKPQSWKGGESIKELRKATDKVFAAPVCQKFYMAIWGQRFMSDLFMQGSLMSNSNDRGGWSSARFLCTHLYLGEKQAY
jgi:hypothetical protein